MVLLIVSLLFSLSLDLESKTKKESRVVKTSEGLIFIPKKISKFKSVLILNDVEYLFKQMKECIVELERAIDDLDNYTNTVFTKDQVGRIVTPHERLLSCAHKILMEGAPPSKAL